MEVTLYAPIQNPLRYLGQVGSIAGASECPETTRRLVHLVDQERRLILELAGQEHHEVRPDRDDEEQKPDGAQIGEGPSRNLFELYVGDLHGNEKVRAEGRCQEAGFAAHHEEHAELDGMDAQRVGDG